MPTNDPTAPRVVGDPSIPRDEVHFVVDGKTVGKIVGLDPAPRVVGGGDADALRKAFVDGYVKALGAEDDPWVRGHAELEAKEYPAVLPEDGRTCVHCHKPKSSHFQTWKGLACVEPRGNALYATELPVPALRESGAGRGGAMMPTVVEVGSWLTPPADPADHTARMAWKDTLARNAPRILDFFAQYRPASPGGGAPTEGLSEGEAMALKYAIATLQSTIDPRWANLAPDVERGIAKHLAALESLASRLTRSPRAAGEPSDTERLDWIEASHVVIREAKRGGWFIYGTDYSPLGIDTTGETLRETIDKARARCEPTAPPPERAPEGSSPHRPPQSEGDA